MVDILIILIFMICILGLTIFLLKKADE